jgi:hypothetical protein
MGNRAGVINIAPPADVTLFLIVSLLISAAVVPITLLPSHPPPVWNRMGRVQTSSSYHLSLRLALSWLAWLSVVSGAWARTSRQSIGLDVGGISAFMAAVLGGTLAFHGHSVGFRIECPGILSSPVRRWRPQRLPSA